MLIVKLIITILIKYHCFVINRLYYCDMLSMQECDLYNWKFYIIKYTVKHRSGVVYRKIIVQSEAEVVYGHKLRS